VVRDGRYTHTHTHTLSHTHSLSLSLRWIKERMGGENSWYILNTQLSVEGILGEICLGSLSYTWVQCGWRMLNRISQRRNKVSQDLITSTIPQKPASP
jgi:hypothetical protein